MATFRVGDLIKEQPDGSRALQTTLTGSDNVVKAELTGSYVGYSNDTKPTGKKGETFLELDTLDVYVNDGAKWVQIT